MRRSSRRKARINAPEGTSPRQPWRGAFPCQQLCRLRIIRQVRGRNRFPSQERQIRIEGGNRMENARNPLIRVSLALAALAVTCLPVAAQTTLKWAHVYEVNEPYHTEALWAAEEIKKRTNGKYEIQVFPASQLGNENQINEGLGLGTVDIIYTSVAFA